MVDLLFEASKNKACQVLTDSLVKGGELNLAEHKVAVQRASMEARAKRLERENNLIKERGQRGQWEEFPLKRAQSTGTWLMCFPSRLHGTELSAEEFRENIRLRYNLELMNMPSHYCDGCGMKMDV